MPRTKKQKEDMKMDATAAGSQFTVVVSDDVREFFARTVIRSTGGFQSLCRILKDQLSRGAVLHMDEQVFRRVIRYAEHYGDGGFQSRMRKIAVQWLDQNFNRVVKTH
jgi:hypothetical protein